MIVVDSSVWISHLRNHETRAVATLLAVRDMNEIIVADLVLLEVLQGARYDGHAEQIERRLRSFEVCPMLDDRQAVESAKNYRRLRAVGITVRKTIAIIIASFCITNGHVLLHDDRDFDLMADTLGLLVL